MKISKIYLIPTKQFETLVQKSNSISEILKKLGLHPSSGNYRILKRRLSEDNINYTHIKLGIRHNLGRTFVAKAQPLEQILIINSQYKNPNFLKHRLLKEGLLQNICYKCSLSNIWNGETLSLQIDHINGVSNDNRLENLRILCPNCHSQTSTYAAKNKTIKIKPTKTIVCRTTKIIWPSNEELLDMIHQSNYVQVGKKLGVSDNAVRKRIGRNVGN